MVSCVTMESPTTRQTARALQEVQARRMSDLHSETPANITARVMFTANTDVTGSAGSVLSQDEEVIKARGRRSVPLVYSPDVICSPGVSKASKTVSSSRLLLPPTRSSPRKRLRLQDSPPARGVVSPVTSSLYSPSPDKLRRSPVSKRVKLSSFNEDRSTNLCALRTSTYFT